MPKNCALCKNYNNQTCNLDHQVHSPTDRCQNFDSIPCCQDCKHWSEDCDNWGKGVCDIYHGLVPFDAICNANYYEKRPPNSSSSSGCYVATCVYQSYDCPQVWTLRRYRDNTLAKTRRGRAFIKLYYAISPTLVRWFGKTKWFKKLWKPKLDRMVAKLNKKGVEDTPYQDQ